MLRKHRRSPIDNHLEELGVSLRTAQRDHGVGGENTRRRNTKEDGRAAQRGRRGAPRLVDGHCTIAATLTVLSSRPASRSSAAVSSSRARADGCVQAPRMASVHRLASSRDAASMRYDSPKSVRTSIT
jgi:hypothetical protein